MPWRCPGCGLDIQHHPPDRLPDPMRDYRCHLCRLNLRFDPTAKKMMAKATDTKPAGQPKARK